MTYIGDFRTGKTIRSMWNSNAIAGESITRATNGTVSVYKDGGTTQSTTGVTDTEDFDSLTGVHLVAVDTSADGTFYSAGSDFVVVLSGATIDGKTINAALFSFSLENRSGLMPTTDGRKLDVSTGGEAGVDWANIGSPTTAVNLSGTTVKTATDVETDTQDIQTRLPAALGANGNIKADVRDFNGTAGTFASGIPAVNAAQLGGATVTATTSVTFPSTCTVATTTGAVGSVTGNVGGNVTGSVGSIATGGITAASLAADCITAAKLAADVTTELQNGLATASALSTVDTNVSAIKAKTDNLPASPAATGDIPTATQNADALLNRDMSAVTVTNSRSPINALRALRNKFTTASGTYTVYKEDDSTTAWTAALTTDAAADPITASDPT